MATKFNDEGKYLQEFLGNELVVCPQCSHCAIVQRLGRAYSFNAKFVCNNCGLTKLSDFKKSNWAGPVYISINKRCGNCGNWIRKSKLLSKMPKNHHQDVQCNLCKAITNAKMNINPISNGNGLDIFFGLPLWLQMPFRQELFWAFNAQHLRFIKEYVASELRYRQPNRNTSLASTLPGWIKERKNREDLLRCIEKLEAKLVS